MGISGHMLGPRKLRRLSRLSGLDLDRAYIRNRYAEGRVLSGSATCTHFRIDPRTGESTMLTEDDSPVSLHWSSCPREGGDEPTIVGPPVERPPAPPRLIGPKWRDPT